MGYKLKTLAQFCILRPQNFTLGETLAGKRIFHNFRLGRQLYFDAKVAKKVPKLYLYDSFEKSTHLVAVLVKENKQKISKQNKLSEVFEKVI